MAKKKIDVTYENVFADLGLEQSDELIARAKLLYQVGELIKSSKLSQKDVATKLEISQPKVSTLVSGKLSAFSTDTLLHYLSILGCNVQIKVRKPKSLDIFRQRGCIAVC